MNKRLKVLDISLVPIDQITLSWLSGIFEANKIDKLIISDEQSRYIFSMGEERWIYYRECLLEVKK